MTFNIQSISAKFSDFCELISLFNDSNCSPDVICLQELWQFSPFMNLSLNGYHPLCYKLRNNAQGGGVGIYVKNHLQFKVLHECSIFMDRILESLFIEIALPNNSKFTIGTLYRPGATHPTLTPQELFHEFIELFSNLLDNISDRSNLIILGDFNLDVLQFGSNNKCNDYVDLLFSFGLLQIVTRPTRCNDNSATLIDHIVTNIKAPVYDINILTSRISDHFPVIFTLPFNKKIPSSNKTITKRFFTNENVLKFKTALNNINWNVVRDAEDAQVSYNSFSDIFFNFYELYFPKVTLKVNKKNS